MDYHILVEYSMITLGFSHKLTWFRTMKIRFMCNKWRKNFIFVYVDVF